MKRAHTPRPRREAWKCNPPVFIEEHPLPCKHTVSTSMIIGGKVDTTLATLVQYQTAFYGLPVVQQIPSSSAAHPQNASRSASVGRSWSFSLFPDRLHRNQVLGETLGVTHVGRSEDVRQRSQWGPSTRKPRGVGLR